MKKDERTNFLRLLNAIFDVNKSLNMATTGAPCMVDRLKMLARPEAFVDSN